MFGQSAVPWVPRTERQFQDPQDHRANGEPRWIRWRLLEPMPPASEKACRAPYSVSVGESQSGLCAVVKEMTTELGDGTQAFVRATARTRSPPIQGCESSPLTTGRYLRGGNGEATGGEPGSSRRSSFRLVLALKIELSFRPLLYASLASAAPALLSTEIAWSVDHKRIRKSIIKTLHRGLLAPMVRSMERYTISDQLFNAVKLARRPAYRIALEAGINPSTLSRLLHGAERVRPGDGRVIAVGEIVGLTPEECFAPAPPDDGTHRGRRRAVTIGGPKRRDGRRDLHQ